MSSVYSGFAALDDQAKKMAQFYDWKCKTGGIKKISNIDDLTKCGVKLA